MPNDAINRDPLMLESGSEIDNDVFRFHLRRLSANASGCRCLVKMKASVDWGTVVICVQRHKIFINDILNISTKP